MQGALLAGGRGPPKYSATLARSQRSMLSSSTASMSPWRAPWRAPVLVARQGALCLVVIALGIAAGLREVRPTYSVLSWAAAAGVTDGAHRVAAADPAPCRPDGPAHAGIAVGRRQVHVAGRRAGHAITSPTATAGGSGIPPPMRLVNVVPDA
jgi:hypothetical protein